MHLLVHIMTMVRDLQRNPKQTPDLEVIKFLLVTVLGDVLSQQDAQRTSIQRYSEFSL